MTFAALLLELAFPAWKELSADENRSNVSELPVLLPPSFGVAVGGAPESLSLPVSPSSSLLLLLLSYVRDLRSWVALLSLESLRRLTSKFTPSDGRCIERVRSSEPCAASEERRATVAARSNRFALQ